MPFYPGEVAGITKAQFSPAVVVVLALPLPGIRKSLTLAPALGYGTALQTVSKPGSVYLLWQNIKVPFDLKLLQGCDAVAQSLWMGSPPSWLL